MKRTGAALAVLMALLLCWNTALAASKKGKSKTTPTPPPMSISEEQEEPPEIIRQVLDIAYEEWVNYGGRKLKNPNKFTEWRGKGIKFGWCGGYITWCMLEAGVPMETLDKTEERSVDGVVHVKEASVGKLLRGYQRMGRTSNIPQKGFLVVYGAVSYNKTIHIGLVYDVEPLGNGKYRLTTLEGNMGGKIRMFVHDYDSLLPDRSKNLTPPPAEDRVEAESNAFSYKVAVDDRKKSYWVNCFLMPWIPGEEGGTSGGGLLPALRTPVPGP